MEDGATSRMHPIPAIESTTDQDKEEARGAPNGALSLEAHMGTASAGGEG